MNDCWRFDLDKRKVYFGTNGDVTKLIRNTRPFLFGDLEVENGYDPMRMLFFECVHDSTAYKTIASCDENGLCHVTAMLQTLIGSLRLGVQEVLCLISLSINLKKEC